MYIRNFLMKHAVDIKMGDVKNELVSPMNSVNL